MQIGTYARTTEQVFKGLESSADFIELRMDSEHRIVFDKAKTALSKAGIPCTLHLPSDRNLKPIDLSSDLVPYIDLAQMIEAELVVFHSPISPLLYSDEEIDAFLQEFPLAYEAAKESGVTLAVETMGFYYTEMMLVCNQFPNLKINLDIGHGQLLATRNRALDHIENHCSNIEMVNVHDNNACEAFTDILNKKKLQDFTQEELREMAIICDKHLPIGDGSIEFAPIFSALKERNYDGRFLMLCSDPLCFDAEREKFMKLWLAA